MAEYICIDGGTTNTRISLVRDHTVTDTVRLPLGAGNAQREILADRLRQEIAGLLKNHALAPQQIPCILASGMITSERGLYELPHIPAPAGPAALHAGMQKVSLPHITSIPFVFIPGVKRMGDTPDAVDMMRGEETELAGLFAGEGLYILPGSHSKHIAVGADGTILEFRTMLTGEMLAALASHTILRDAIALQDYPPDSQQLYLGYAYAAEHGLSEALFKVRVLKNLFHKTPAQLYHFFLGAVLCPEVQSILRHAPKHILLGGQKAIQEAMALLLPQVWDGKLTVITPQEAAQAAPLGMVKIYEYRQ